MTNRGPIDAEEMRKRLDEDAHAVQKMIGEGSPVFDPYPATDANRFEPKAHVWHHEDDLPETYQ